MDHASLAYRISSARQRKNLSQQELGALLGVSNKAISKWENGSARPRAALISRLSELLDIPLEQFLEDYGHAPSAALTAARSPMGMPSLSELYRIGRGPSSSHTIAPLAAARAFSQHFPYAPSYAVHFYGSLAYNCRHYGIGPLLESIFSPASCTVSYDTIRSDLPHPNTFDLFAFDTDGKAMGNWRVFSTGGGAFRTEGDMLPPPPNRYPHTTFDSVAAYCKKEGLRLWEYVAQQEGDSIWGQLQILWQTMKEAIQNGLAATGYLPGDLKVERRAGHLFHQHHPDESAETKENRLVCAYAFAVSEENAAGGTVVTAPTCGACGVLPAVLLYSQQKKGFSDAQILHALATAGLIGNLIKTNASISGAECGCQAEIGSACSMAAAALAELYDMELSQIEYAAEIAIEHHLGLTCDPIHGLIQIPCIERNAVAAMRAINAVNLANFLCDSRKISFDLVVQTMYETGKDLSKSYRETGQGGLAKLYP